jgi:ribose/xylose/arabinose/galactoside ABC-type transport system permease subunit
MSGHATGVDRDASPQGPPLPPPVPVRVGRDREGRRALARRLVPPRVIGLWGAIVVVGAIFAQINPAFLSSGNLLGLLRSGSTLGIVALGAMFVIIAADIDLSVGSVYIAAPVVLSVLWVSERLPFLVAVLGALAVAALVGMFNALMSVTARIPSFIVTLGTLSLVEGLAIILSGSQLFTPLYADPPLAPSELQMFANFGGAEIAGLPAQLVWLVVVAAVLFVVLHFSIFGFRLTALGGNEKAARFARLPVTRYRYVVFVLSAALAGLAGIIDYSFLQSSQPTSAGAALTFPVMAAVIIGGASLTGGTGTILGTLTGAVLLTELGNGLSLLGVGAGPQLLFTGAITIAAVGLDQWSKSVPVVREWFARGAGRARSRA